MINEMRKNNFFNKFNQNNMNRWLEVTYDKWNRFENFVKFASAKEVKDRLKEVDPPPVEHYVDGDVVYKIKEMGQGRPPRIIKKPLVTKNDLRKQNKERVTKMKELYGLKNYPAKVEQPVDDLPLITQNNQKESKVFEYQENLPSEERSYGHKYHDTISTESVENLPVAKEMQNYPVPKVKTDKKPANSSSLYSFYQNIIDKNTE